MFVLVIMDIHPLRLIATRVTANPSAEWTARVLNFEIPEGEAPAGIVHDRDPAFESAQFRDRPSLNQVKNLRCPSLTIRRALKKYQTYYNRFQPHQGIDQKIPALPGNRAEDKDFNPPQGVQDGIE
jgi:hypothetical protein